MNKPVACLQCPNAVSVRHKLCSQCRRRRSNGKPSSEIFPASKKAYKKKHPIIYGAKTDPPLGMKDFSYKGPEYTKWKDWKGRR